MQKYRDSTLLDDIKSLRAKPRAILKALGISTLLELSERFTFNELCKLGGIGKKSQEILRNALHETGNDFVGRKYNHEIDYEWENVCGSIDNWIYTHHPVLLTERPIDYNEQNRLREEALWHICPTFTTFNKSIHRYSNRIRNYCERQIPRSGIGTILSPRKCDGQNITPVISPNVEFIAAWLRTNGYLEKDDIIKAIHSGDIHWRNRQCELMGPMLYEALCRHYGIYPYLECPAFEEIRDTPILWRRHLIDRGLLTRNEIISKLVDGGLHYTNIEGIGHRSYLELCRWAKVNPVSDEVISKNKALSEKPAMSEQASEEIVSAILLLERFGFRVIPRQKSHGKYDNDVTLLLKSLSYKQYYQIMSNKEKKVFYQWIQDTVKDDNDYTMLDWPVWPQIIERYSKSELDTHKQVALLSE